MKTEHEIKLDSTEMSIIRWMCGFISQETETEMLWTHGK